MRDRTIRRRRLTLLACVIASLGLLTAYFGESTGGGLHALQRGMVDVMSPIQEGANRALKPVRDLAGWAGDTVDAKDERDKLRRERDTLRAENAKLRNEQVENVQLRKLVGLEDAMKGYEPLTARVYQRSPSVWNSTLTINRGSNDGLRRGQPVLGDGALVGKVAEVMGGSATVTLLTDEAFAAGAKTARGEPGLIEPAVGSQNTLVFDPVSGAKDYKVGDLIMTSGTVSESDALSSLFPSGIPIGRIKTIDEGEGPLDRVVKVAPSADLRRVEIVQVLLHPGSSGTARASASPGQGGG